MDKASEMTIRVLIADDHDVIREGLQAILDRHERMTVVGEAEGGREAILQFRELQPDVLITDLQMRDMEGDEVVRQIRRNDPKANILIYSNYDLEEQIRICLADGARGYVLKDASRQTLFEAIETVSRGQQYVPPNVAGKVTLALQRERLTDREREVLSLLARGDGNRDISKQLHISEATVKTHLNNILGKLKAKTRTEAVTEAVRRGLVKIDE